jgi:hypothetical protein
MILTSNLNLSNLNLLSIPPNLTRSLIALTLRLSDHFKKKLRSKKIALDPIILFFQTDCEQL